MHAYIVRLAFASHHHRFLIAATSRFPQQQAANPRLVTPSSLYDQSARRAITSKARAKAWVQKKIEAKQRIRRSGREAAEQFEGLLDQERYPVGTFGRFEHGVVNKGLRKIKAHKARDAFTANVAINMMERFFAEICSLNKDTSRNQSVSTPFGKEDDTPPTVPEWLTEPKWFAPIFQCWKDLAFKGEDVMSPMDVLQKVQNMIDYCPDFPLDRIIVDMILEVVLKREDPRKAPAMIEEILEYVRDVAEFRDDQKLLMDAEFYNKALRAWAASGLPEAETKMMEYLNTTMRDDSPDGGRKRPNINTFNIFMQHHSGCIDKMEEVLDAIEKEEIKPQFHTLSLLVTGYCEAGVPEKADDILQNRMLKRYTYTRPLDRDVFVELIRDVLKAYEESAAAMSHDAALKDVITDRADKLSVRMQVRGFLPAQPLTGQS